MKANGPVEAKREHFERLTWWVPARKLRRIWLPEHTKIPCCTLKGKRTDQSH